VAAEAQVRTLRAVYERDRDRVWTVRIPAIRGCHTYGRTIEQARSRIREALRLWVDDPEAVKLIDDVRLPAEIRRTVTRADRARQRARAEQAAAQRELRAAASSLERAGLSRRDAGTLLGLSRQRVQQLGVRGWIGTTSERSDEGSPPAAARRSRARDPRT